ncbi:hypothetical protein K439DRAFT_1624053, partial [Ramaria rubella]
QITRNGALDMCWKNYGHDIVNEYRVVLEGWPSVVFNPAVLGHGVLKPILDALLDGTCIWRRLTNKEFAARKIEMVANGGIERVPRKERSEKGKKRGTYSKGKQKARRGNTASDEDEETTHSSSSEEP